MKRRLLMSFSLLICVVAGLIGAELDKDDLTVKVDIQKNLTVVCFTIDPYLTASAESAPVELKDPVPLVQDAQSNDTRSITVYASARTNRNERLKLAVYASAMTLMSGDNYTGITVPTTINGTPVKEAASNSSFPGTDREPVCTFTESEEKAGSGLRAVLDERCESTGNSVTISAKFDSALEGTYQAVLYMVIQSAEA